jgi:hypothetical protein
MSQWLTVLALHDDTSTLADDLAFAESVATPRFNAWNQYAATLDEHDQLAIGEPLEAEHVGDVLAIEDEPLPNVAHEDLGIVIRIAGPSLVETRGRKRIIYGDSPELVVAVPAKQVCPRLVRKTHLGFKDSCFRRPARFVAT